jgi:hypothetical protein
VSNRSSMVLWDVVERVGVRVMGFDFTPALVMNRSRATRSRSIFRDLAKNEDREESVMKKAFERLAHSGRYSLFSSFNTRRLIETRVVNSDTR